MHNCFLLSFNSLLTSFQLHLWIERPIFFLYKTNQFESIRIANPNALVRYVLGLYHYSYVCKSETSSSDDESLASDQLTSRSIGNFALVTSVVGWSRVAHWQHGAVERQLVADVFEYHVTVLVPRDHNLTGRLAASRCTIQLQPLAVRAAMVRRRRRVIYKQARFFFKNEIGAARKKNCRVR